MGLGQLPVIGRITHEVAGVAEMFWRPETNAAHVYSEVWDQQRAIEEIETAKANIERRLHEGRLAIEGARIEEILAS